MTILRWDETWQRLRLWTSGSGQSERLAAQILAEENFERLDPSHPLGGKDGGKDATCTRDGKRWVMAVYFPKGQKSFGIIKNKVKADFKAARLNETEGFVFVTNQEVLLDERAQLIALTGGVGEIFHLERITQILDKPIMYSVRRQFLGIGDSEANSGGKGGDAYATLGAIAIGGTGGSGSAIISGGDGGDATASGPDTYARGGDGGNAGTPDGRGGKRTLSQAQIHSFPAFLWGRGCGGAGANAPEYERRLILLTNLRAEYVFVFPDDRKFLDAGVDTVPLAWINKRLEELEESWRISRIVNGGYEMPTLPTEPL